ncbi:hypothetical protein NsoK4_06495 [Nitrosopumilus sp. K4]|uniref:hypothetical protein n=1 Tax=Nitrosopumilus sp. K4 TaxID=2795383 RepID=UPI001BA8F173|nr:hypothetical protein [Nitrosopumilus sp. K4]QUC64094.1 hypothetical protein NsoK4_06495 [Nitrosopumilus sp. K4]
MVGFDHLLAKSLNEVIRTHLGDKAIKKIEDRLFEKFGISLTQSIEQFEKFDLVLREFFGKGADGVERKIFEDIFQTNSKKSKGNWHTIKSSQISSTILQNFGDPEKKKIIESVLDKPKIIADILDDCNLPQTSGYRKINSLIDDGLLVSVGQIIKDNKKINKYVSVINNVKINIEKNNVVVELQLTEHQQQNSSILQTIQQL